MLAAVLFVEGNSSANQLVRKQVGAECTGLCTLPAAARAGDMFNATAAAHRAARAAGQVNRSVTRLPAHSKTNLYKRKKRSGKRSIFVPLIIQMQHANASEPRLWIRIHFFMDPDPAVFLNADPAAFF